MADWVTISALATAGGTLVLAGATFSSVRSANRAARVAERSLLAGLRPLLMPSRIGDPPQKVGFMDDKWFYIEGGQRTISRYALLPRDDGKWLATIARHWNVDRPDPR